MFGAGEQLLARLADGRLHRVEGAAMTGQHGELENAVQSFLQGRRAGLDAVIGVGLRPQTSNRHAVGRQGARLVDAQHRGRSEQFNRRDAARQHLLACQAPRTQAQKQGQHHGQFLWKDGHGQRQSGQQAMQPVARAEPVRDGQTGRQQQADDGHALDDPTGLVLDRRVLAAQGRK
jgi:hypothetical protein